MSTRLPFRLTALVTALSIAIPVFASAADAPAAPDAAPAEAKSLDTVIVTGTRSTSRTEAESLSPIDVLTPTDLASSGASDLAGALSSLLPSLDFPQPALNDGNDALRAATLRGLSPDDVLVLVDGKRFHTSALVSYLNIVGRGSAPVDLNAIPISAIDHIEVLRDGASAQYGSDAIAGVINIVLKHGAKEGSNDITINGGQTAKGDGSQNGVGGSVGYAFGAADADGKTPGWARISFNYQNQTNTQRAENSNRADTIGGCCNAAGIPYERYGQPAEVTYQALVNFGYTFSPDVELYGYVDASRRDVTSNGYYRFGTNYRNVEAIYPNGTLPQIVNHTNDLNSVIGLRGTLESGWHWDASIDYGKNHLVFDIQDSLNTNLYYSKGYSPTYFYAGTFSNAQTVYNFDMSKDFNWSFLPNAVTFAWGAEYRREQYTMRAGDPASYYFDPAAIDPVPNNGIVGIAPGGSQVYPGIAPPSAGSFDRNSKAVYVDFETNVTDKLSVGVAGRYEDYSDAGATRSGKISARYQFTDTFALRGTISNGFRAPSLAQENYESTVTQTVNNVLSQTGTYRTSDAVAIALGSKPLVPEKSVNYSLGTVWQPFENFSSTLDVYQIRINNQILYSDLICVGNVDAPAQTQKDNPDCKYILPKGSDVTAAQFFVNGGSTRTRGADLINSYKMDLDHYGILILTASGNWNQTSILSINTPNFGNASQQLLTLAQPRTKYVLGSDWQISDFGLHLNETRYGAVTAIADNTPPYIYTPCPGSTNTTPCNPDQNQKFAARWLTNLSGSYKWNAWTFTAGADNVFNVYPTKAATFAPYEDRGDGLQYSSLSPFGFNGRYAYVKVGYKF